MKRRKPTQRRARETVEAILEAVVRILKKDGAGAVTTNRIAQVAGVSIGSVYQYFPDKRAIFVALHDRHVDKITALIDATVVGHADSELEDLLGSLLDALVDVHDDDPQLFELLDAEVPHRGASAKLFERHLRGAVQLAIKPHVNKRDLERTLFVVVHLLDALAHGVVSGRPDGLSKAAAKAEALRALRVYLDA